MPKAELSTLRNSLEGNRPKPAKADLKVNGDQSAMTTVVKDALMDACGSLKAASISMDIDQGQLTRELQAEGPRIGKLAELEPAERALVFDKLHAAFGSKAEDPKALARRELREIRQRLDHVEDLIA